jgi:hypothetical protein
MLVPYLWGGPFSRCSSQCDHLKDHVYVSQVDFGFSLFIVGPRDWCQVHVAIVFVCQIKSAVRLH